ncbi:MAG TPA: CopG family transcriptional regulator [Coxiellaceae bacterium]|nr:CopG family transcriptional regulator [Coxiellaceae bacterium]
MARQQPAITLSIRINAETRDELEQLANAMGRTKSFLAAEAIESYLSSQAWQIKAIEQAVIKAASKKAKFIDHEEVVDWLNTWGHEKK